MQEIIQLLVIGASTAIAFNARLKSHRQLSAFIAIGLTIGMAVEFLLHG